MNIELISASKLSLMTDIKEMTLRKWAREGTLPYYKIGKLVRFNPEEVYKWIKEKAVTQQPNLREYMYEQKVQKPHLAPRNSR